MLIFNYGLGSMLRLFELLVRFAHYFFRFSIVLLSVFESILIKCKTFKLKSEMQVSLNSLVVSSRQRG